VDPALLEEEKEEEESISVGDFIFYDKDHVLRTEAYYVTK